MANSNYPSQLDTDLELPRVDNEVTQITSEVINSLRDAIFAIERTLGINPQGNTADLVSRINSVIDSGGNIRGSALTSLGLVTLPITNSQISATAAIEESKLALTYGTAALKSGTDSVKLDVNTLRTSLGSVLLQTGQHYNGTGNRHSGTHIDLVTAIRSQTTVESALQTIDTALSDHENSVAGVHLASGISIDPISLVYADNVQAALAYVSDFSRQADATAHGSLHTTAISSDESGVYLEQGNLPETTLASCIYNSPTVTSDTVLLKVLRPNSARITSKSLDLGRLSTASVFNISILAGGMGRSALTINLTSVIPTYDINAIVDFINNTAHSVTNHYPISAYNTNGKLTLAHNLVGEAYTITLSTVASSAYTALGFADVVDVEHVGSGVAHSAWVAGEPITDVQPLLKIHYVQDSVTDLITPGHGDLLTVFGVSTVAQGKLLCNIVNHSTTATDNGTHYISDFSGTTGMYLSSDIQIGEFDLEVWGDAIAFNEDPISSEVYDVFLETAGDGYDGYGILTRDKRILYSPITNVVLKGFSEALPTGATLEWDITSLGVISLLSDSDAGVGVTIPSGFVGDLQVFARDGVNYATVGVLGSPGTATQSITNNGFGGTPDRLYLSSVHFSGAFASRTLAYLIDRRQIGAVPENTSSDAFEPLLLEQTLAQLRNNGVIRGLEIESSSGTSFVVTGGLALVNGKLVEAVTQTVTLDLTTLSFDSSYWLLLNQYGTFIVKDQATAGFTLEELTESDAYGDNRGVAIIAGFDTSGSAISGYANSTFKIQRLDKIFLDHMNDVSNELIEVKEAASGSLWGVTNANLTSETATIARTSNANFTSDYAGFVGTDTSVTTRTYAFSDSDLTKTRVFRAVGATHINIFTQIEYKDNTGSAPFGVTGTVGVYAGVSVTVGSSPAQEQYALIRTITSAVFPSNSVIERYVASIPLELCGASENGLFSYTPKIQITGANYVDGGGGSGVAPLMVFSQVSVVLSSYSVAGSIENESGATSLGTTVGDVL